MPTRFYDKVRPQELIEPGHNSTSAWEEFLDGQKELPNLFNSFDPAARVARKVVDSHFDAPGYESRTPLLRKYASAPPTLMERVRTLLPEK